MVERDGKLFCFDEFNVTDVGDAVILRTLMDTLWDMGSVLRPASVTRGISHTLVLRV